MIRKERKKMHISSTAVYSSIPEVIALLRKEISIDDFLAIDFFVKPYVIENDTLLIKDPAIYALELEKAIKQYDDHVIQQELILSKVNGYIADRTRLAKKSIDDFRRERGIEIIQVLNNDISKKEADPACNEPTIEQQYQEIRQLALESSNVIFHQEVKLCDDVLASQASICYKHGRLQAFLRLYHKVQRTVNSAKGNEK